MVRRGPRPHQPSQRFKAVKRKAPRSSLLPCCRNNLESQAHSGDGSLCAGGGLEALHPRGWICLKAPVAGVGSTNTLLALQVVRHAWYLTIAGGPLLASTFLVAAYPKP